MADTPDYLSLFRLEGRCCVVLGGGDGIGRQTSTALAQAGAHVVVVDRDLELARTVAEEIGGFPMAADVTDREELERVFDHAHREHGPIRGVVDVVGAVVSGSIADTDDAMWERQFDLVLRHAFLAVQIAGRWMSRDGGGSMVLVGSTSGTTYTSGQVAYGAAKSALHHLAFGAGRELGSRGIRVNVVAPGYTRTPRLDARLGSDAWQRIGAQIPRGYAATPSEIAAPVLFLLSDAASYVNGHVLMADGGLTGITPSVF